MYKNIVILNPESEFKKLERYSDDPAAELQSDDLEDEHIGIRSNNYVAGVSEPQYEEKSLDDLQEGLLHYSLAHVILFRAFKNGARFIYFCRFASKKKTS